MSVEMMKFPPPKSFQSRVKGTKRTETEGIDWYYSHAEWEGDLGLRRGAAAWLHFSQVLFSKPHVWGKTKYIRLLNTTRNFWGWQSSATLAQQ